MAQDIRNEAFPRTADRLNDLPMELRWEVVRRNPDYVFYWDLARDHLTSQMPRELRAQRAGEIAIAMMREIGIGGVPPDPALGFNELDDKAISPEFLLGAITPLTYRQIFTHVMCVFTAQELGALGHLFRFACDGEYAVENDPDQLKQREDALNRLRIFSDQKLDSYMNPPLIHINLDASQNAIAESVSTFVRRHKGQRGEEPQHRVPIKKFSQYFQVWDLREAWADGSYSTDIALTLP